MKSPRPWIVTRHDPIRELESNLWAVQSDVPGLPGLTRWMHIIKLSDGRLAFHNAVPVDDASLAKIRAFGTPAFLFVAHHLHALDANAFREKLNLKAYCPKECEAKCSEILPVEGTFDQLPKDAAIEVVKLNGVSTGECAFVVKSGARATLVLSDAIMNMPRASGFRGFIFNAIGFTGDAPKVTPPYRIRVVRDRKGLRGDLEKLADTPGLSRLFPTHGPFVETDVPNAVRRAAATL
jgi:hypothetical protein